MLAEENVKVMYEVPTSLKKLAYLCDVQICDGSSEEMTMVDGYWRNGSGITLKWCDNSSYIVKAARHEIDFRSSYKLCLPLGNKLKQSVRRTAGHVGGVTYLLQMLMCSKRCDVDCLM